MIDGQLFLSTFVTLLVIMDPPGALPIFLALTGRLPARTRNAAARRASLVALFVITMFAVSGRSCSTTSTSPSPPCRAPADCSCCSSRSNC